MGGAATAKARNVEGPRDQCGGCAAHPEARLGKANKDRLAAVVERDALHRNNERFATKVKTLEREAAQQAKAPVGKARGPTAEGEVEDLRPRGAMPPALSSFSPDFRHGTRRLRRPRDRCRLSPVACAWPCWRAGRRSTWRRWHLTWHGSKLPMINWRSSTPPPPPTASWRRRWTPSPRQ